MWHRKGNTKKEEYNWIDWKFRLWSLHHFKFLFSILSRFTQLIEAFDMFMILLKTQFHRLTPSLAGRLTFSARTQLFENRFWRSLRFCHLGFDRKPFLMFAGVKMPGICGRFWILSHFRELSFGGPCGPC